jgi:YfiH family protein
MGSLVADCTSHGNGEFRLERLANGWLAGRFDSLSAIGVPHLVTTREGPDVQQVRRDPAPAGREIAARLGLKDTAFLEQVHGGDVLTCEQAGCAGFADGLVTTTKGLAVMGKSGDCPIVLIADRKGRAVGFAHASWRATVAGIVPTTVRRMVDLGCRPGDLVACICPSAGPCCYEVGDEVRDAAIDGIGPHAAAFFHPSDRRHHFDLWQANTDALVRCGLCPDSIHVAGVCTLCRNDLFPSHRREGNAAGRFAAVVGLVGSDAVRRYPSDAS